jgi:hypothetical protein
MKLQWNGSKRPQRMAMRKLLKLPEGGESKRGTWKKKGIICFRSILKV